MDESIRKYAAEFLGTFTLVFVGTAVATLQGLLPDIPAGAGWLGISFAFGFTLLVLVLTIGPVSGCHINPAVTIAMALAGKCKWALAPGYIIAQIVGALVASGVLLALLKGLPIYAAEHGVGANGNPEGMHVASLFGWELVLTALFLLTIFSATREGTPPAATALAIGGFLFVAHLVGAPLGDSSLNPARSIGPAIFQGGEAMEVLWVFILAPIVGGILGLGLFRIIHAER